MKEKKYKGYIVCYYDDRFYNICKKVIENDYKIKEVFKDTVRNYVVKIEINGEEFVLKSPKAENIIPQRKFFSAFKKGEAITTLLNTKIAYDENIKNFVKIYCAIVKKNIFIKESYILMESIQGDKLKNIEDVVDVMRLIKRLHLKGIYHGDLNTSNFIKTKNGLKIIDSQVKREKISKFNRWYDIFTLKEDLLVKELKYDVFLDYNIFNKSIWYYFAKILKNFKNLYIIREIKRVKKNLREKGFKI